MREKGEKVVIELSIYAPCLDVTGIAVLARNARRIFALNYPPHRILSGINLRGGETK